MKIKHVLSYVVMLTVAGILAASAQVWNWSQTATSNATIDPVINWQEGIPPSTVNDNARAIMARVAQFRDDTSGMLADTGTSSAYSVTSNSGSSNPPKNGQTVCFTPANTNVIGVTFKVDGGTAYPVQSPVTVGVGASIMIAGTPYCVVFNTVNSSWVLRGFMGNPFNVPLGTVLDYTGSSAPNSNFVLAFGQAISRTGFPSLFALVGTTYGSGNGTTTFNVPDLRGRMVAGLDNMGGSAANRITTAGSGINGVSLGAAGGAQNYTMARSDMPNVTISIPAGQGSHSHTISPTAAQAAGNYNPAANQFGAINGATATQAATLPAMNTASINGNVTQTTINTMTPTMVVTKILRVL